MTLAYDLFERLQNRLHFDQDEEVLLVGLERAWKGG